jgi:hypothetical protein
MSPAHLFIVIPNEEADFFFPFHFCERVGL